MRTSIDLCDYKLFAHRMAQWRRPGKRRRATEVRVREQSQANSAFEESLKERDEGGFVLVEKDESVR